jgi:hypothetical protein
MYVPALKHTVSKDYSFVYATKPMRDCFLPQGHTYCKRVGDHVAMLLKPGDIVAIAFASWKMTPVRIDPPGFQGSLHSMAKYVEFIHQWSNLAQQHGASVLVLGDETVMPQQGLMCIPSPYNPNAGEKCVRPRKWGSFFAGKFRAALRHLLDNVVNNTYFFDPRHLFCDDTKCSAMIPGTLTLAIGDQEHLTIEGSTYLWPFLCSFLSKHGLLPYRR